MMRARSRCVWIVLGWAVASAAPAWAQVIDDRSFVDALPSTLIDFETRGDGTPIVLRPGDSETLPAGEYAAQGVTFNMDIEWVNDAGVDFSAAQAIGGSPDIGIPDLPDDFTMFFDAPVRAFGFWVVNNRTRSIDPRFEAFDASGASLGIAVFNGSLIDGITGIAEYGFMGIASPGAPIASVRITKDATMFDDLILTTASACRADVDGDGALTIFDFLLFSNLYQDGDAQADFDGDGELTLFDFLAFQTAFDAGCP